MKYKKTLLKKTKKRIAIENALLPFAEFWKAWSTCHSCPLEKREVFIIENYLQGGSNQIAAMQLNISVSRVEQLLIKTIRRLKRLQIHYNRWIATNILKEVGLIKYKNELDYFLNAPLEELNIPQPLKRKLIEIDFENMNDVLKISSKELLQFRCFGKTTFYQFTEYLQQNNCSHLLKL